MADPETIGRKVLDGLAKGRQRAIAQAQGRAARHAALILDLARIDMAQGRSARGLAGRISRKLGGTPSESHVRKILRRLFGVRDSEAYSKAIATGDRHEL